ncbi:MAG: dehydrogenase [Flavobacteriaceae bacterium]|nr:dehydrogenase [Flavobacteriaceae bacterium]MEE2723243.1 Gfo/Idh/MocA family oxidoreductase [Bacteroidota bacterium]
MKSKQNNLLSRRNFVKRTTLATTGILSSGLPVGAVANVNGNKKLKIALVGCGGRGTGAIVQALQADENTELIAMADAFQDRVEKSLKAVQEHFDGVMKIKIKPKNLFSGFDAYKKAIDLADVVILTTPPGFRPYHFEYAIENGKHVFMEKPVATDPVGVRKVLDVARVAKEKRLNVVVGLQRHYQKKYIDILNKINNGKIGKITGGQVYWNSSGVWVRERQPDQSEMEYQMRNWYYFNWLCGDHILEQHIHNIDVANWFIGDYPLKAQGMGGRQVRNGKDHGEIFDHHFVEFTYKTGAVISSQCRHQPGCMRRVDESFQGTKGSVNMRYGDIVDLEGKEIYRYKSGNNTKSSKPSRSIANGLNEPNPYQVEHDKLFASIRNGGVIADAENGAKSTLTAIMGRMATYSGKEITWDQAMNSKLELMPENPDWNTNPPTMPDSNGIYSIPTPGITTY